MPQRSSVGRVFDVYESDKGSALDAMLNSALPGDTFRFHDGDYGRIVISQPGTFDKPILYQAVGNASAYFILISDDYAWVDGFTINMNGTTHSGIHTYHKGNDQRTRGIVITRCEIVGPPANDEDILYMGIKIGYTNNITLLDTKIHGSEPLELARPGDRFRYHFPNALNASIISWQHNIDGQEIYHNEIWWVTDTDVPRNNAVAAYNYLHDTRDDMESDKSFLGADAALENFFSHTGPVISTQSNKGNPKYFIGNMFPNSFNTVMKSLKFRGMVNGVFAKNSGSVNNEQHTFYLFRGFDGVTECKGGIVANNYLKAFDPAKETAVIGSSAPPDNAGTYMGAFGWNAYEKAEDDDKLLIWNSSLGFGGEENSIIVSSTPGGGACDFCYWGSNRGGGGGGNNGVPTATSQTEIVFKNEAKSIQLSGTDPEGKKLTYALVSDSGPSHGSISNFDSNEGTLSYTPDEDYEGDDSFRFTVSDGSLTSASATIALEVITPTPVSTGGLVLYHAYDETNGVTASDSSDNSNDGNLISSSVWGEGKINNALSFESSDSYVSVSDDSTLDISGPMTISLWMKTTSEGVGNNNATLFAKTVGGELGTGPSQASYEIGIRDRKLRFRISDGSTSSYITGEGLAVMDGNWHHLTAVWDGTAGAGSIKIYKNGKVYVQGQSSITSIFETDLPISINDDGKYHWKGAIDDVCLFSRALSEDEILTLASGRSCGNSSVLVHNSAPEVDAGADQTITLPSTAILDGTVTDDGFPDPPATLTTTWSEHSVPGTVIFEDANSLNTTATFSKEGTYILSLEASDSELSSSDTVTITVSNTPTIDLCFHLKLGNRHKKNKKHNLSHAKVVITNKETQKKTFQKIVPIDDDGNIRIKNIPNINTNTQYNITIRPRGYLPKTISSQTLTDQNCPDYGIALVGDLDDNDQIDISDLTTSVRHYLNDDNETLRDAFPDGFNLSDLVIIIKNFVDTR